MLKKRKDVVITTIYCSSCLHYKNPKKIPVYPKSTGIGWRNCAAGNTVNKKTSALNCGAYSPDIKRIKQPIKQPIKRVVANTPTRIKATIERIR